MRISSAPPLALAVFAVLACAPANASVEGLWRTPTDNGEVRVEACGAKICARLVTSDRLKAFPDQRDVHNQDRALRDRPLKNALIAQGFSGGPTLFAAVRSTIRPAAGPTAGGSSWSDPTP